MEIMNARPQTAGTRAPTTRQETFDSHLAEVNRLLAESGQTLTVGPKDAGGLRRLEAIVEDLPAGAIGALQEVEASVQGLPQPITDADIAAAKEEQEGEPVAPQVPDLPLLSTSIENQVSRGDMSWLSDAQASAQQGKSQEDKEWKQAEKAGFSIDMAKKRARKGSIVYSDTGESLGAHSDSAVSSRAGTDKDIVIRRSLFSQSAFLAAF